MTKARSDGLYLVFLGAAVFLLLGFALENAAYLTTADFRTVYDSAKCLLENRDPYQEREMLQMYHAEGAEKQSDTPAILHTEARANYLPTAFPITVPFATLHFGLSHWLWLTLTAVSFITAAILMWGVGAQYSPILSGGLVCLFLANGELLLILGNPAGIAVSLCVVAVWCFVRERLVPLAIGCFALSLMLKPHDVGLIWLYFLLAGRANRKRALQTLIVTTVLSAPAVIWITRVAPHWISELNSNVVALSSHGDVNDPGPSSIASHGIGMIVSLQAVFSVIRDEPWFYNSLSYLVCGILMLIWILKTFRTRFSPKMAWFAVAPIAAISLLPIYHRIYDAEILLLTIPACAMLWAEGSPIRWIAILVNTVAIVLTGGLPWAIFFRLLEHLQASKMRFSGQLLTAAQVFPAPLIVLVVGIFYLWIYVRQMAETVPD